MVAAAVTVLQAQGVQPSVRKIHALIGGSFRDIQFYMRQLFPETGEEATVESEMTGTPATTLEDATAEDAPVTQAHRMTALSRRPVPRQPAASCLTWEQLKAAAEAVRRARSQNIWTSSDAAPTPERVVAYFDAQHTFFLPIARWEVWAALRPAVTDRNELTLLDQYVEAFRREQPVFTDTHEYRLLKALWQRLIVDPTV